MSFSLSWGSRIHVLLDIRASSVALEFVRLERDGSVVSVAKTTLPQTSTGLTAQSLIAQCKEIRTKYPQLHPQSILAFLHTPHIVRSHTTVHKKIGEQVLTAALVAALLDDAPKDRSADIGKDMILVHEYVQHYRVNGYRVADPRGKVGHECSATITRSYISPETRHTLLAPLEETWGVPARACSWSEFIAQMVMRETDGPIDFILLDIGESESECTRVSSAETAPSVRVPLGMKDVYAAIRDTTEMKDEEVRSALPLLASKTLEEQLARRLTQGVVSAARMVHEKTVLASLGSVQPVLPVLGSVPAADALCGTVLFAQMPFATMLPPGDMPKMASMVGL